MKSGMLAAEAIYPQLTQHGVEGTVAGGGEEVISRPEGLMGLEVRAYDDALHSSWVADELRVVRNTHASFHLPGGTITGMAYTGLACLLMKGREPWTIRNLVRDAYRTQPAKNYVEIKYPKPDGSLSFDLLTNLQRSGVWEHCMLLDICSYMNDATLYMNDATLYITDAIFRYFARPRPARPS